MVACRPQCSLASASTRGAGFVGRTLLAARTTRRVLLPLLVAGLVVAGTPGCGTSQEGPTTIVSLDDSSANMLSVPFAVLPAAAEGRELTPHPVYGIEVAGVWADGNRIEPEPVSIHDDRPGFGGSVRVPAEIFIYRVTSFPLFSDERWRDHWMGIFGSTMHNDMDLYAVPNVANEVRIQYRVRDKSRRGVGPLMTLRLLRHNGGKGGE